MRRCGFMGGIAAGAVLLATQLVTPSLAWAANDLKGDSGRGKDMYQNCTACHSIDENDLGPKHRGVVGRQAGSVVGYGYSAALKDSGLIWDENLLDRWLTNPSALVPGTKMYFKIDDPQTRADIIAYLKQLK